MARCPQSPPCPWCVDPVFRTLCSRPRYRRTPSPTLRPDHDGTRRPDRDTPPRFPRIATRVGASSATGVPALPPAATPRPRAPWTASLGWQQRQAPSLHKPTLTTTRQPRQREALAPARTPRIPVRGGPGPPSRSTTIVRSNDRARTLPRAPRRSRPARRPRSGAQAAQEEQAGRRPAVPPATQSSEHPAPAARISSAPRLLRRPPVWRQGPPPNHWTPDDLHPPHRHLLRPGRGPNRSTRQNRDHAPDVGVIIPPTPAPRRRSTGIAVRNHRWPTIGALETHSRFRRVTVIVEPEVHQVGPAPGPGSDHGNDATKPAVQYFFHGLTAGEAALFGQPLDAISQSSRNSGAHAHAIRRARVRRRRIQRVHPRNGPSRSGKRRTAAIALVRHQSLLPMDVASVRRPVQQPRHAQAYHRGGGSRHRGRDSPAAGKGRPTVSSRTQAAAMGRFPGGRRHRPPEADAGRRR